VEVKIGYYYHLAYFNFEGSFKCVGFYNQKNGYTNEALFEFDADFCIKENIGYFNSGQEDDFYEEFPDLILEDGKDYDGFSVSRGSVTPAFKCVKDTKLARKMYPDAKEEDGNLLVRL
jgi:hypothetical protein